MKTIEFPQLTLGCVSVCVCVWFRIFLEDLYNLAWSSGPRVVRIDENVVFVCVCRANGKFLRKRIPELI